MNTDSDKVSQLSQCHQLHLQLSVLQCRHGPEGQMKGLRPNIICNCIVMFLIISTGFNLAAGTAQSVVCWAHCSAWCSVVGSILFWASSREVCLLVGFLTSQQHACMSRGQISWDNFTCCHTEIEVADQTYHLTQSQYTDTGSTCPSTDPKAPGAWQAIFLWLSHW